MRGDYYAEQAAALRALVQEVEAQAALSENAAIRSDLLVASSYLRLAAGKLRNVAEFVAGAEKAKGKGA